MLRSGNPALKESTFLDLSSGSVVSRDGDAMTLNGTVNKTALLLFLAVLTAAFAWNQVAVGPEGISANFPLYLFGLEWLAIALIGTGVVLWRYQRVAA